MSSVKIQGSATGTANFTIAVPDGTSTDRTINLPDAAGSFVLADGSGDVAVSGVQIRKDTASTTNELLRLTNANGSTTDGVKVTMEVANTSGNGGEIGVVRDGGSFNPYMYFSTSSGVGSAPTERVRIDASGNLLVGTTDTTPYNNTTQDDGVVISGSGGWIGTSRNNNAPCLFNRTGNDGEIISVRKNGTTVGGISTLNGDMYVAGTNKSLMFSGTSVLPRSNTGGASDATVNLGGASNRYNNIYASNGTINTSDASQKQQIASLTDDEITAAKAISKLFKTYKWNSAVEAEGDAARTHAGVVAQEVEQAMTDAGLDATQYGFFCSDTWWEADETYNDDDGVEQTRTITYDIVEEAPANATERTRLGIRYPELLAFIGAATEQRLASIEARLDALEAV